MSVSVNERRKLSLVIEILPATKIGSLEFS